MRRDSTTDCVACGCTETSCSTKRWLAGHGCCSACDHEGDETRKILNRSAAYDPRSRSYTYGKKKTKTKTRERFADFLGEVGRFADFPGGRVRHGGIHAWREMFLTAGSSAADPVKEPGVRDE